MSKPAIALAAVAATCTAVAGVVVFRGAEREGRPGAAPGVTAPVAAPLFEPRAFLASSVPRLGRAAFASVPSHVAGAASVDATRVLMRFRSDVSSERIDEIVQRNGGRVVSVLGPERVRVVEFPADVGVKRMLDRFAKSPEVQYVEPNLRLGIGAVTDDPFLPGNATASDDLWALDNNGQNGGTPDADIDAPDGWRLAGIDSGTPWPAGDVTVGVVDTGVDATHPDLAGRVLAGCANAVTGSGVVAPGCPDDHGHGTHVSGTIAAVGNNGVGIVGVAPNARVLMCKALDASGSGWTTDIAACINDIVAKSAAYDIRVISMSLGGGGSTTLEEAVDYAAARGILIVAAAGNDGASLLRYPAGYANAVSVAAADRNDKKASFSNANAKVEIAAPGVAIVSTVPAALYAGGYGVWSGTSMATPHVAAVAALVSWKTGKTSSDLRSALDAAADDLGPPGRDEATGFGRVNLCKSLGGCGAALATPSPSASASASPSPTPVPTATPAPSTSATPSPTPVPVRPGRVTGSSYYRSRLTSGVVISFRGASSRSVTTRSGRYAVDLAPGTYDVTATYGGRSCRAGSSTGPTRVRVGVVSGATKTVNWFC